MNDVSTDRELRRGGCSSKNGISVPILTLITSDEPYNDKQPVTRSPLVPGTMRKSVGRSQALVTHIQCPPLVATVAPLVIEKPRPTAISTSRSMMKGILVGSQK